MSTDQHAVPDEAELAAMSREEKATAGLAVDHVDLDEYGRLFDGSVIPIFLRRRSIGSIFNSYAISSIADSSAKLPVDSPGARIKVGRITFIGSTR